MPVEHQSTSGTKIESGHAFCKSSIAVFYSYCFYGVKSNVTMKEIRINTQLQLPDI